MPKDQMKDQSNLKAITLDEFDTPVVQLGRDVIDITENESLHKWKLLGKPIPFCAPKTKSFRMHFAAGKGGLGKTMIASIMSSHYRQMKCQLDIFDLCSSNPSSRRYFKLKEDRVRGSLDKDLIGEVIRDEIYPLLQKRSVFGDLGGSAEVPFLDYIDESGLSELFGEQMVLHVPIGPLDSVGTAISIAQRAPATPIVVYLNHRDRELRMVVRDLKRRKVLDTLLATANVIGVIEIPDLTAALTICSRISAIPFDATTSDELTPIERAMCQGAMRRIEEILAPLDAWLS